MSNSEKKFSGIKHTPGPWDVNDQGIQDAAATVAMRGKQAGRGNWETPTVDANARLIAAAPDMAEALRRALPWINKMELESAGHSPDLSSVLFDMRAALAKAGVQS